MSAVSTSLLLFLNLLTRPRPPSPCRWPMAASRSLPARAASATSTLPPASCSCSTWRSTAAAIRLRATTPDGKALRATELAGRQSLGLQAGERQGLRLTFSADEDTALTLIPTQRLTPQTPALDSPAPQSPTLQRLQAELAEKRPGALKAFWKRR